MRVPFPIGASKKLPRDEKQRVELRDFVEELKTDDVEALRKATVLALLQTAQNLIEDHSIEIQHLRRQLFGQRSEKVSKDQLNLFTQILESMVEQGAGAPSNEDKAEKKEEGEEEKPKKKEDVREASPLEANTD